jgi:hypothetical protein
MKTTNLLFITLASLIGTAAHAKAPPMPTTAKLLFQTNGSTGSATANGSAESYVAAAVRRAEVNIENRIKGSPEIQGGLFGMTGEPTTPINVEYECRAVYREWTAPSVSTHDYARGGIFDGTSTSVTASVTVNVYCVPRDFRQKVSISAMQACEKEPKVECMSKEYMDAFSKIEQTNFYDVNKP